MAQNDQGSILLRSFIAFAHARGFSFIGIPMVDSISLKKVIGLFVDAKDNHTKEYYEQFGFISLNGNPLVLFLPIKTLVHYK